jgi:hypothetical protein
VWSPCDWIACTMRAGHPGLLEIGAVLRVSVGMALVVEVMQQSVTPQASSSSPNLAASAAWRPSGGPVLPEALGLGVLAEQGPRLVACHVHPPGGCASDAGLLA